MKGAPAEKWVESTTPDDPTRDVAVRALRNRLGAVLHWLRQAACNADKDVEHVYQLRVWSRRATAVRTENVVVRPDSAAKAFVGVGGVLPADAGR
jgi:hypothetical protein